MFGRFLSGNADIFTSADISEYSHPFGDTNNENRFPYPSPRLESSWALFSERYLCFVIFNNGEPTVNSLMHLFAINYIQHMRMVAEGKAVK